MKILFYCEQHIYWCRATTAELIEKHIARDDEITLLCCGAHMLACPFMPNHDISHCLGCAGTIRQYMRYWPKKLLIKNISNLTLADREKISVKANRFLTSSSIDEWEKFLIGNFDIGNSVLSTLISLLEEPKPDLIQNKVLLKKLLISSLAVHYSIQNYLNSCPVDRVYVFNGRYATSRAVLRACQNKSIECFAFDTGCDMNHYMLYTNSLPHDIKFNENLIWQSWEYQGDTYEDKKRIAAEYFSYRANRIAWDPLQNLYTKNQSLELMPNDWDPKKNNVVIFCSSENEFAAIGPDWNGPIYPSQMEGIHRVIDALASDDNIHLYLRVHPHLIAVKNSQTKQIESLQAPNLTVIAAESPVSSYALMRHASKVLTFGSLTGIEAAFFDIPSITAGKSFYCNLGSTYNPTSHEELIDMLRSNLAPKDKTGALMYGYYRSTFGYPYQYYKPISFADGTFRGSEINRPFMIRTFMRLLRLRICRLLRVSLTRLWIFCVSRRIMK